MLALTVLGIGAGIAVNRSRVSLAGASVVPAPAPDAGTTHRALPKTAAAIANPALAAFVDQGRGNDRVPSDFDTRVPSVREPSEIAAVIAVVRDRGDGPTVRHEAINLLRRSRAPELVPLLLELAGRGDEKAQFRAYVVQHLGENLVDSATQGADIMPLVDALRRGSADPDLGVRRQAFQSLLRYGDEGANALVALPLADARLNGLRDLIVHEYPADGTRRAEVRSFLYSASLDERIAAIAVLGQWQDKASAAAFADAAASKVPALRRAGELASRRISELPKLP